MVTEITIKLIGEDEWYREVYENVSTGSIYKRYKGESTFYTSSGFHGEPDMSLREDIIVNIV